MLKRDFSLFFILGFILGLNLLFFNRFAHAQQVSSSASITSQPQSSNTIPSSVNTNSSADLTAIPIPVTSAFNYSPLPADNNGPQNDISEISLISNRSTIQVDDWATFSVTIKNIASYKKAIQALCFESTAGNFGCDWGINLSPGQTYTANNVGSWTSAGRENIWVTWTQDGINWYQPLNSHTLSVNVI